MTRAIARSGGAFDAEHSFFRESRPWLLFREEDDVLILPPNKVFKLNATARNVYKWLLAGGKLDDIPGMDEDKAADVRSFFADLKGAFEGGPAKTERVPYDFSYTRLPVLGEIALTYRCNNRCRFCYAGCGPCQVPPGGGDDMDTKAVRRVIDLFAREAKIPFFSFTGGEPLLRDDLESLCAYATRKKLRINLITNGTLATEKRAKSLYRAGLRTAQVSLESPDATEHDSLCGAKGSWERTLAGIAALKAAGILVQTNTTITTANKDSLERMPAFLQSLGIGRFSMNLFIPTVKSPTADELFVRYSAVGTLVDAVARDARGRGMRFFWYSPTPYCVYNPVARGLGNKNCAAVDGLVHVNPKGDILPCSSWDEPIGNVFEKPFRDIWFSERAGFFKQKLFAQDSCRGCSAFVACQSACPLYFMYAGHGECRPIAASPSEAGKERANA